MDRVADFLLLVPILLFSIVAHEYAHGYAALRMGDATAQKLGRLTWNPVKHLDPFLSLLLPVVTFYGAGFILGAAKPVPVDPRNYRELRKGDIIVSLAGVTANLLIALAFVPLLALFGMLARSMPDAASVFGSIQYMLRAGIFLNLILIVFNLLPIPPLDGSHVMKYMLPPRIAEMYVRVGMYGMAILMVLLFFGGPVLDAVFWPARTGYAFLMSLVGPYALPGAGL
ncbi:MAG TPA: site-2 protease family protein [Gemmatimonadaceae bacterium]|nr:site-2 protease family protein [Gemmatimonadaceae bacterium]